MELSDSLEFSCRDILWKRHNASHLKRFFELRTELNEIQAQIPSYSWKDLTFIRTKHENLQLNWSKLKRHSFNWTKDDDLILEEGNVLAEPPEKMRKMAQDFCDLNCDLNEEEKKKDQGAKKLIQFTKEREEYLMNYDGTENNKLAPEFGTIWSEDPITKLDSSCVSWLKPWVMTQFYDVKVIRPGVWEASRLAGQFTLYETNSDEEAVCWLKAASLVPEFQIIGAFRGYKSKIVVVSKLFKGTVFGTVRTPSAGKMWPLPMCSKFLTQICKIMDLLWDMKLGFTDFTPNDVIITLNGTMQILCIDKVATLKKKNDKTMIHQFGKLVAHFIVGKRFMSSIDIANTKKKSPQLGEFIQLCLIENEEYCLSHPLFSHKFVQTELEEKHLQWKNAQHIPLKPIRTKVNGSIKKDLFVTGYLPSAKSKQKYLRHYKLIRAILSHFETNVIDPRIAIEVVFKDENVGGKNVSESLITEAWRFLLENHSSWEWGPRGFILAEKGPCEGCSASFCHFTTPESLKAIGRWMNYTIIRSYVFPYPLDYNFLDLLIQPNFILDYIPNEDMNEKYETLLKGRETELANLAEGLTKNTTFKITENFIDGLTLASWLSFPQRINREKFQSKMNLIFPEHLEDVSFLDSFREWLLSCPEYTLRWFFMEMSGCPFPESLRYDLDDIDEDDRHDPIFTIQFTEPGSNNGSFANVCQNTISLPAVYDKDLFFCILDFRGPFLFNKH